MEFDIQEDIQRQDGVLERVDPFYLPIFQYKNAINDEQCEALRKLCEAQKYAPSVAPSPGKEVESARSTQVSVDKVLLHNIPDMKEHFELLIQDISFQVMKQNSQGFDIKSSWCTKTEKGQGSPLHLHKNYYLAAILYLQDDNNLIVESPYWMNHQFLFPVYEQSPYTCNSTLIASPKNSLLIMPAWMKHEIPIYDGDEIRYSIAMNIHPTGEYGLETSWISVK